MGDYPRAIELLGRAIEVTYQSEFEDVYK